MGVKGRSNSFDSPKTEVGEIDTRAPFASVKAAVSLFGEVALRKPTPSTPSKMSTPPKTSTPEQKPCATETQLHLAQKELNKFREQLENAETTRLQALTELGRAKKSVQELTAKLAVVNESKELALKAAEAAKTQTNQLKEEVNSESDETGMVELERSRELYAVVTTELDVAKQELRRIRKEFEASVEAKISAFSQESEAKQQTEENALKADQLSNEIGAVQESLVHVKLATDQAQQAELKIRSEKDSARQLYRLALEETMKKLDVLQENFNPELHKELESKLSETDTEINAVRKQLEDSRASDLELVNFVTAELDGAKEVLQKVAGEESSLRSLVESLKLELEMVMKQHNELKDKDAETEAHVADLHIKLQECKAELEAAVGAESKSSLESGDLMLALQQLQSESETALREAETMKKEAEAMRAEAESARHALAETERKLEVALNAAEEAKAAEARALDDIKSLSAKASAARSSTSAESGAAEIMISKEEYESISQKVEESQKLAEMKVSAAAAQVEAVKASETEAAHRLEVTQKEIEEIEAAREDALKRAEMAEAAKKAVEGELRKWREKEHQRATEMAARLVAETEEGAGVGVGSTSAANPKKPRLLIEDYPYAVDGLEIWAAIETWVKEYCSIYYPTDAAVGSDAELQAWWKEVREVGHGDLKDRPWWPKMQTVADLAHSCTIIIWIASALHAAVNFGQYAYTAFVPNRPTISRRFMPVEGTPEYDQLRDDPEGVFLRTITSEMTSIIGATLMEILSTHASDEVYLGTRDSTEWTNDGKAIEAFKRFGASLEEVAGRIDARNRDPGLQNRVGPVNVPYTLLYPTSSGGITGKGIPNSISI